jgi:hypothetical protein
MLRKTIFAVAAVAAIGATALIPTEASAKGFGKGFGHHRGLWGFGAAALLTAGAIEASCYRWVDTRYGPVRVNVCE